MSARLLLTDAICVRPHTPKAQNQLQDNPRAKYDDAHIDRGIGDRWVFEQDIDKGSRWDCEWHYVAEVV